MSTLANITNAEIRDSAPTIEGEILTRPLLLKTDGVNLTYAADVKIPGYSDPLRVVPIASAAGEVLYAETGAAVTLARTRGGKFEITGFAKRKPGRRVRIPVNVESALTGAPIDVGLSSRPLTFAELGTIGGGWGAAPWGGVVISRGATVIEVR